MDARKNAVVVLALSEYRKLEQSTELHLNNIAEEEKKRRVLISIILRERNQIILVSGAEWEVMLNMDDDTFARHFRVTKPQFEYLLMKLQDNGIQSEHLQGLPPVPVTKKVLMFLWYMANQNSFREMSDKFDVSQSSAHRIIMEVLNTICTMGSTFISWPNACEKAASAAAFHRLCGLDGVIGAIDGCHIRVQRPPIRGGDYMNCKSFYSILLQGIVDERGRFIDIFAGPPGRVHDARMLRASRFYSTWQEKMGECSLLGDSAYSEQAFPFVITPKRDNGALTEAEQRMNVNISCGRVVVEQAFGRMKCKWRRLRDLQNTRVDVMVMIVMAACFLHNMSVGASEVCQEHPGGCPRQGDENV
ncbi:putative nuclease HARBI1 [Diretmus argenteus]